MNAMTVEQRASEIHCDFCGIANHANMPCQRLLAAELIREAIAEEREACAKIAEHTNDCCECSDDGCHVGDLCPTAKAIRGRS